MPVSIEATSYAKPWDNLKQSLANSARFRTLVGAADVAAALLKIFFFWDAGALDTGRAILRGLDEDVAEAFALHEYEATGPIVIYFEKETPEAYTGSHEDAGLDFLNDLGKIRHDLQDNGEASPDLYPIPTSIQLAAHGEGDRAKNNGVAYWGGELIFNWQGQ